MHGNKLAHPEMRSFRQGSFSEEPFSGPDDDLSGSIAIFSSFSPQSCSKLKSCVDIGLIAARVAQEAISGKQAEHDSEQGGHGEPQGVGEKTQENDARNGGLTRVESQVEDGPILICPECYVGFYSSRVAESASVSSSSTSVEKIQTTDI